MLEGPGSVLSWSPSLLIPTPHPNRARVESWQVAQRHPKFLIDAPVGSSASVDAFRSAAHAQAPWQGDAQQGDAESMPAHRRLFTKTPQLFYADAMVSEAEEDVRAATEELARAASHGQIAQASDRG